MVTLLTILVIVLLFDGFRLRRRNNHLILDAYNTSAMYIGLVMTIAEQQHMKLESIETELARMESYDSWHMRGDEYDIKWSGILRAFNLPVQKHPVSVNTVDVQPKHLRAISRKITEPQEYAKFVSAWRPREKTAEAIHDKDEELIKKEQARTW